MAERERENIIEELAREMAEKLLRMRIGTRISIAEMIRDYYLPKGYEFIYMCFLQPLFAESCRVKM